MPFDLDATTHRFEPVTVGLVQTVTADDPADTEQLDLIRSHLEDEAQRFADGDYGDPTTIHGEDMPGLAELEAGHEDIAIAYEATPESGRISYATDDATRIDALHRSGEAQVTDHGSHAEDGSRTARRAPGRPRLDLPDKGLRGAWPRRPGRHTTGSRSPHR